MNPKIDPIFPPRKLTKNEHDFLSDLSSYTMNFDKSLSFCIDDLQRHTELVLSGEMPTRWEFPDGKGLDEEIEELENLIERLEKEMGEKMERGELKQEEYGVLEKLKEQLRRLKEARENVDGVSSSKPKLVATDLLGLYQHNSGLDSRVTLYVNNIERAAGHNSAKTMYLMGQVLLHEYFHSFYYHTGGGTKSVLKCAEEPMAEFGSLVVLESVASSVSTVASWANAALPYVVDFVKDKQKAVGTTAAYGFGAYLYEHHLSYAPILISRYAEASRWINARSMSALKYKYIVYPIYPATPWLESTAFMMLKNLIRFPVMLSRLGSASPAGKSPTPSVSTPASPTAKSRVVVQDKVRCKFAFNVFKYLESEGLLDDLKFYITTPRKAHLIALVKPGYFNITSILLDYSISTHNPKLWFPDGFIIGGKSYRLYKVWRDGKNPKLPIQIDEFVKMLDFVYPGRFKFRKVCNEYILEA